MKTTEDKIIKVSAGIFWRQLPHKPAEILLALRPHNRIFAGYWEFPGGKIEEGESAISALKREIIEELGVQIKKLEPFETLQYIYPHANVKIYFFVVTHWSGVFSLKEHGGIAWQEINAIKLSPLLPANNLVFAKLLKFIPQNSGK